MTPNPWFDQLRLAAPLFYNLSDNAASAEVGLVGRCLYRKGGLGTLFVDDCQVAQTRVDKTMPFIFSGDDFMDEASADRLYGFRHIMALPSQGTGG
jgi:hypothetical protein